MFVTSPDGNDVQEKLHRLELLVRQAERLPDPAARDHARELVQALLDLHAAGLERLLGHVAAAGESGDAILGACTADDEVSGLLLLHGLHPVSLEDRVRQALGQVRPFLRSHGGTVELLGTEDGVVRLRFDGGCGCGSSTAAVRNAIEEAVYGRAPDVAAVEIEGLEEVPESNGAARFALPLV